MFAGLYPKAITEEYYFSQTQTYQHTFTGFILLTIQRRSKNLKFSGVSCGLPCYVRLGGEFSLWTTPLSLFPSCYIIDIFSTPWHLHLLKSLCYFYFLKRDSQGGMFRFSLSFLFVSLGLKLFSFYFFCLNGWCSKKQRLEDTGDILKLATIHLLRRSLLTEIRTLLQISCKLKRISVYSQIWGAINSSRLMMGLEMLYFCIQGKNPGVRTLVRISIETSLDFSTISNYFRDISSTLGLPQYFVNDL